MKAAQSSLPLSAILLIGFSQSAVAGPQSLLDPYATVKAPTKKATPAGKKAASERAVPQSITIGGGALPPLQRTKPRAATTSAPAARSSAAPARAAAPASKPIATVAPSSAGDEEGFIAGTKQIFQGIGTATKGAVVTPARKLGSAVAGGAKGSGGFFASGAGKVGDGFKAMGGGFKSVGGKLKDGTVAVGGKIKDGSAAAGHAIVAAPKALMPGSRGEGEKIAEKPAPKKDLPGTPIIDDSKKELVNAPLPKLSPIKPDGGASGGDGIGSKLIGMPKTAVKGIGAAAAKTGESAKKVAGAPIGFFGKLNPFKSKEADIKTAAKDKPQQIASPSTETPIK